MREIGGCKSVVITLLSCAWHDVNCNTLDRDMEAKVAETCGEMNHLSTITREKKFIQNLLVFDSIDLLGKIQS